MVKTTVPAANLRRPDRLTLLAFAGVVLFGGVNAIAVKKSVEELAPFWSAGLRFVVAGLLLVAIVVAPRRPCPPGRSVTGARRYGVVAFAATRLKVALMSTATFILRLMTTPGPLPT